jgi:sensor histidine kinase regulating citrate/malate metabolism
MDTALLICAVLLAIVLICVWIRTRRHRRQLRKHDEPKLTNAAKYFAADLDRVARLAPK